MKGSEEEEEGKGDGKGDGKGEEREKMESLSVPESRGGREAGGAGFILKVFITRRKVCEERFRGEFWRTSALSSAGTILLHVGATAPALLAQQLCSSSGQGTAAKNAPRSLRKQNSGAVWSER